jgi:hypothetical protein
MMSIQSRLFINSVIPAQRMLLGRKPLTTTAFSSRVKAGIQPIEKSPHSGTKLCFVRCAKFFLIGFPLSLE